MEYTTLFVKENFGNKKMAVRIISKEKINDITRQIVSEMTFDEAVKFGNVKGWKVLAIEE